LLGLGGRRCTYLNLEEVWGVRDVRKVNLSLMAKWRWRLIHGESMLWKEVLCDKYGSHVLNVLEDGSIIWAGYDSKWWKDVMGLEWSSGSNWFNSEVIRKVGNRNKTSFWNHVWLGEGSLRSKYPHLYDISNQKESCIGQMRGVRGGWEWHWRRNFFVWEENLFANLVSDLEGVLLAQEEDRWPVGVEVGG